jgi:DNA-binding transcriptional LysR family regulator
MLCRLSWNSCAPNLEEQVDLALRVGALPDSSMIATPVGTIRRVACASPAYLKIRGIPKKPADLASHDFITYEGVYRNNWVFQTKGTSLAILVPSRLVVNSVDAAVIAATAGRRNCPGVFIPDR